MVVLDELWRRRIIREQGVDGYDFSHDRIREVAYSEISPMLRRHLHRRVAQALANRHAHELDAASGQIAVHYELAGDSAQALHFNELASLFAVARFAHADAIHFVTRALALAPTDDLHRRFTLLARREGCYAAMAQPEPRLADLTEMMALARRLLERKADARPNVTNIRSVAFPAIACADRPASPGDTDIGVAWATRRVVQSATVCVPAAGRWRVGRARPGPPVRRRWQTGRWAVATMRRQQRAKLR